MTEFRCECGVELTRLELGSEEWRGCSDCGREHQLVAPDRWKQLAGWSAGAIFALYMAWGGHWFWYGIIVALGFVAGRHGYFQYSNRDGILSPRSSSDSELITRWTTKLSAIEQKLQDADEKALSACVAAVKKFESRGALPRLGHLQHGKAVALCAVISWRLGKTRDSRKQVEQLRKMPPLATPRYWEAFYYVNTGEASDSAIQFYIDVLKKPQGEVRTLLPRIRESLKSACDVSRDLSSESCVQRIRWNRATRKVLQKDTWPTINEARAWYLLGQYDRCITALGQDSAENDNWQRNILLAQAEFQHGHENRATKRIAQLETQATDNPDLALELVRTHFQQGREKRTKAFVKICEEAGGWHASQANILLAKTQARSGQVEEAKISLMVAVQHDIESSEAVILLASLLSQEGRDADAERLLIPATRRHTRDNALLAALGRARWNAGKHVDAAEAFETAVRNGSPTGPVALLRAKCLLAQKDFKAAADVLDQADDIPVEHQLDAAFSHGVALLLLAQQSGGEGASRALPYFTRAVRYAKKQENAAALKKSRLNLICCYKMIAEESATSKNYAESAKAWQQLAKSFKAGSSQANAGSQNAAETLFRAATNSNLTGSTATAVGYLQTSLTLRESSIARHLLGALWFSQKNYRRAQECFETLRQVEPENEHFRFGNALSGVRAGDSGAKSELMALHSRPGPLRLRAALALAAEEVETDNYSAAATFLTDVLTESSDAASIRDDAYFGESCCKAALYLIKAGRSKEAVRLIDELLGHRYDGESSRIIGAILSEAEEFAEALKALRNIPETSDPDPLTQRLLAGVAVRVAMQFCAKNQYAEAREAMSEGLFEGQDEAGLFWKLLDAACSNASDQDQFHEQTLQLLEKCASLSEELAQLVARPSFVGAMFLVRNLCGAGDYSKAEKLAAKGIEKWTDTIRNSTKFWSSYIESYNDGKDYRLDSPETVVSEAVQNRLTSFWIRSLQQSFRGTLREGSSLLPTSGVPDYDGISFSWTMLKQLVGNDRAISLCRKHCDLQDAVTRISREVSQEEAMAFVKFTQKEMYADERLAGFVANQAFESMYKSIGDFNSHHFRKALYDFLDSAAKNHDLQNLRQICRKISSLGNANQDEILKQMKKDRDLAKLRGTNENVYRQICFQIMVSYAVNQSQFHGGLQTFHVAQIYDLLKSSAIKHVVANAGASA